MKATVTQFFLLFVLNTIAQKLPQASQDSNVYKELARVSKPTTSSDNFTRQSNDKEYVEIFTKYANEDNVHALNMLAQTYQYGQKGLDVNKTKALELYTKAGELGYSNSWFHLGQMYRATKREQQDYKMALTYYELGNKLNNNLCTYNAGYMYYKGLGCRQSYETGVTYFNKGSQNGNRDCMYYLGLCYKNGYGLSQNYDSATKWLTLANKKGIVNAQHEINTINTNQSNSNVKPAYPYKAISSSTNSIVENGTYDGILFTYDWSGKNLIKQQAIEFTITRNHNTEIGNLKIMGDSTIYQSTKQKNKNEFEFEPTKQPVILETLLYSTYTKKNTQFLQGNIISYTKKNYNETYYPQYFVATKNISVKPIEITKKQTSDYFIYPNPFSDGFSINIKQVKASNITATITNAMGEIVYNKAFTIASKNIQNLQIVPANLLPGIYYLMVQTPQSIQTSKLIKL